MKNEKENLEVDAVSSLIAIILYFLFMYNEVNISYNLLIDEGFKHILPYMGSSILIDILILVFLPFGFIIKIGGALFIPFLGIFIINLILKSEKYTKQDKGLG